MVNRIKKLARRVKGEVSLSNVIVLGLGAMILLAVFSIWNSSGKTKVEQVFVKLFSFGG